MLGKAPPPPLRAESKAQTLEWDGKNDYREAAQDGPFQVQVRAGMGVKLDKMPRMADFALWATACETALWPAGTFMAAYSGNREEANEDVIDADLVAAAVRTLMLERAEWKGTATDLLDILATGVGELVAKSKSWPKSPQVLSGRLRRAATVLRQIGIEIDHSKEGRARTKIIQITVTDAFSSPDNSGKEASAASAASAGLFNGNETSGSDGSPMRTIDGVADANDLPADDPSDCENARESRDADDADDADANFPSPPGPEKKDPDGWKGKL